MTHEEQQSISRSVLRDIWLLDREALVMGGAPISWSRGEEARDVDIWFRWEGKKLRSIVQKIFPGAELLPAKSGTEYPGGIRTVLDITVRGCPIQLVAIAGGSSPWMWVQGNFDAPLCEISWDGHRVAESTARLSDLANKQITYRAARAAEQGRIKAISGRVGKLQKKYPGYSVVWV